MPLVRRLAALALALLLLPTLSACGLLVKPKLEVDPGEVHLDTATPSRDLLIRNVGSPASVLHWQAHTASPLLRLSSPGKGTAERLSGSLWGGQEPHVLRISLDFYGMQEGMAHDTVVVIEYNGGSAEIPISFAMTHLPSCAVGAEEVGASSLGQPPEGAFAPGELLVGYLEPVGPLSATERESLLGVRAASVRRDHGLGLLAERAPGRPERVRVDDPVEAAAALQQDPRVAYAHPNYYLRLLSLPDDPCLFEQWNLLDFGLPRAWSLETGGGEVVLAVLDSGVDVEHEDLRAKALPGYDVHDDDPDPRPGSPNGYNEHGTHVAGIALAIGDNGTGVAGVAYGPGVKLLPVKVFDDQGMHATISDLVDGILWAAGLPVPGLPTNPHPADVINMSVGAGPNRLPAVDDAARRARAAGAVLLAAAGNNSSTSGQQGIQSPANAPDVLAVGSVDSTGRRSSFSDWGLDLPTVDLMAPGGFSPDGCRRVRSTVPWSRYGCMGGTSMAAPFAAGVAALLLSREPHLEPYEVEQRLAKTTHFDDSFMNAAEYGFGLVCADRALRDERSLTSQPCGTE